jgi:hypothetical protein
MENTTYELRPLLAEIRDGFRGLRDIRASRRAATRQSAREARAATGSTAPEGATTARAATASIEADQPAGPPPLA